MMTIKEVSELSGVSVRTLQYYDNIGLLPPAKRSEAGYRLYDEASLERLQQILLFRELEFPIADIERILKSPSFDRTKALQQQIELLELKKKHIENLIVLAKWLKARGVNYMNFKAFDQTKLDEYMEQARNSWGSTPQWKEFEEKQKGRTRSQDADMAIAMDEIFSGFAQMKQLDPADERVQAQVRRLQGFITENAYTCTDEILSYLGKMYAGGGEFTENIDSAHGEGTAEFAHKAIEAYCSQKEQR